MERSRFWNGPAGRRGRWRGVPFRVLRALLGLGLRLTPLHGRGRRNALDVRRVEFDIVLSGLPCAFDGYRILHVSDPHLDCLPDLVDAARRALGDLRVDMLAMTGDVCGRDGVGVEHAVALLIDALSGVEVRGPRLAILGNHDPSEMVGALERAGLEVLVNRSTFVVRGQDRLCVTGLDDVNCFYTPAASAAFREPGGGFRIALVHSADVADEADEAGYGLYLCGHTHGGQVALPGGRPIVSQLLRCKHASSGLWHQGRMAGYTNRGLGVSEPLLRFNTRGEVVVITLRSAPV